MSVAKWARGESPPDLARAKSCRSCRYYEFQFPSSVCCSLYGHSLGHSPSELVCAGYVRLQGGVGPQADTGPPRTIELTQIQEDIERLERRIDLASERIASVEDVKMEVGKLFALTVELRDEKVRSRFWKTSRKDISQILKRLEQVEHAIATFAETRLRGDRE
jgi:hypothetical protein